MNIGQQQINIDVNSLPDMPCIKCGEIEYYNVTRVKKLSKINSPTGQEGNININMLKCIGCGWLFNPKEWMTHEAEMNKEEIIEVESEEVHDTVRVEETLKVDDKAKTDDDRELCRKCGAFYEKGKDHNCKS